MGKPTKKLISTAYHEAGHAVAAHFQGIKFKRATITPEDDSLGHVLYSPLSKSIITALEFGTPIPARRAKIEAKVINSLAGGIAERKYRGRSNRTGSTSDMSAVIDYILALSAGEDEASAYFKWLKIRTINLIERYWWAVEAIVQALLASETLTEVEVQKVIYDAAMARIPKHPIKFTISND